MSTKFNQKNILKRKTRFVVANARDNGADLFFLCVCLASNSKMSRKQTGQTDTNPARAGMAKYFFVV